MTTPFFDISPSLAAASDKALAACEKSFARIDEITEYNQQKVLSAFIDFRVSESHFVPTTGYGYGDRGRDTLDELFAKVMGAEDVHEALVLREQRRNVHVFKQ